MTVNAACPAANEIAAGATPASRTRAAAGPTAPSCPCRSRENAAPMANPTAVPTSPRAMYCPVLSAFERSTESVPSTTQNECCTPVRSATSTASPSPTAPRTLLCSQTEWRLDVRPRALLGRGQRAASPRAAARAADPTSLAARPPPSDRCCSPICAAAKPSSCARKLGSREVRNSSPAVLALRGRTVAALRPVARPSRCAPSRRDRRSSPGAAPAQRDHRPAPRADRRRVRAKRGGHLHVHVAQPSAPLPAAAWPGRWRSTS